MSVSLREDHRVCAISAKGRIRATSSLWREYKRSMPEGDANFGDFLDTPPAKQVDAKYNPEFIDWATKAKSIPGYLPGSKPSRYDEWKASQPSNKAAK